MFDRELCRSKMTSSNRARPMKNILFIYHTPTTNPGPVGGLLSRWGYDLDIRVPRRGDSLPHTLDHHEAVISFGGAMSANDDEVLPFIRSELDWIPMALASGKPFLGICLGAQLLARSLGARIIRHPESKIEIGYHPIKPTPVGSDHFESEMVFYHWNGEGFDIPSGALKLASGDLFENQAFRYGECIYGLQFHPEMSIDVLQEWAATVDPQVEQKLQQPGAQSWDEQIEKHVKYALAVESWLDSFLSTWLGLRTYSRHIL